MLHNHRAIVLRKVAGRLQACYSGTSRLIGGASSSVSFSALSLGLAVLLLPLALVAAVIAIGFGHAIAIPALAFAGKALIGKLALGKLSFAITAPVAGDAKRAHDELLQAFEEFKNANDERIKTLEAKRGVDPLLDGKVDKINDRMSEIEAAIAKRPFSPGNQEETEADKKLKARMQAFFRPDEEQRERKATLDLTFPSAAERVQRIQAAQAVGTTGAGGALVPQGFMDRLEKALLFYSGMMQESEIFDTDSGADLLYPTVNDTAQVGAILGENGAIPAQDVTFSNLTFKAYMYTSKLIAVSWQLLQDAAFSVDNLVADLAGERVGRILNTHCTTGLGSGSTQPNGVVTAASSGKVGLAGQTTSVIYDDIVDLIHSVDVAYRVGAKFMTADSSIKVIRKLKDSQGRPLWEPSLQAGQPASILGFPVVTNNDVPVMAVNAKSIVFGNLTRYKIRRVRGIQLVRLNERYADNLQTGFFAYARFDGNLVNAGTNPIKYYQNSAT